MGREQKVLGTSLEANEVSSLVGHKTCACPARPHGHCDDTFGKNMVVANKQNGLVLASPRKFVFAKDRPRAQGGKWVVFRLQDVYCVFHCFSLAVVDSPVESPMCNTPQSWNWRAPRGVKSACQEDAGEERGASAGEKALRRHGAVSKLGPPVPFCPFLGERVPLLKWITENSTGGSKTRLEEPWKWAVSLWFPFNVDPGLINPSHFYGVWVY